MNFHGEIPVRSFQPHTSHFGAGSQHGKPYFPMGQHCNRDNVPQKTRTSGDPCDLSHTAHMQTRQNNHHKEKTLRVYRDHPDDRSCRASYSKEGATSMDSFSHAHKIGSKHMCDPRPDHAAFGSTRGITAGNLHRSMSLPSMHPYDARRANFRDPTPWHMNAAFTTTSDAHGKFYSSHMMSDPLLLTRNTFNWTQTKRDLA
mmetsp:Transcript_49785/g.131602  ORF Transcript_49785/g.131602 Transcript_49785/m.131602 type:complete len:201 (-) Transcript_49785:69-671(-)